MTYFGCAALVVLDEVSLMCGPIEQSMGNGNEFKHSCRPAVTQ